MKNFLNKLKQPIIFLLRKPTIWLARRVSSSPDKEQVFKRLTEIYREIVDNPNSKEGALYELDLRGGTTIIFSDHHKGNRGTGDEFRNAEKNYLAALDYYNGKGAMYINLGDSEEFWKFNIFSIMKHNKATFERERMFVERNAFYKIYGNHDLFWKIDPFAEMYLRQLYGKAINIYGGIVIRVALENGKNVDVFCTHGHQGDQNSDGNAFSKWFVTYIWGPFQSFLEININTPASTQTEKTLHNRIMYEWSQQQENLILITGHTHQPIFHSYSHLQSLKEALAEAEVHGEIKKIHELQEKIDRHPEQCRVAANTNGKYRPTYFNAGCCCFSDHSITGIEIADGAVRLVSWHNLNGISEREVLEELPLHEIRHMFFD
ncbi:metallophosphoesterase [Mongoliitalea daihaiensis]|uniref:metallophosphoesterase n=1 Tax=Mongoliitalea daihaiensis TaxID=2782006 RepID=UPI001F45E0EF|nr:metallophosphoesterase [Mongoliitalea daihaiensis]UJP65894.1 metallophosphoesterase [Mongoliitalea daihaiensis]